MTVTNPAPSVAALQVSVQPRALVFKHTPGDDLDYGGIIIAVRQGADPDPVTHRVSKCNDASIVIAELADGAEIVPETEYRYLFAAFDAFGEDGILWQGPGIVTTPGEIYTGTVDWGSQINGSGKPADNADVTADNTAQAIANQGALATRSSVTFHQDTVPTSGMEIGDLWVDTNDGNKLYRYSGIAWLGVQDQQILDALAAAATAQSTADGRIDSYLQVTTPTGGKLGDLWFDTDDGNKLYRHDGASWQEAQDDGISQAILSAATAQSTADGKVATFYALESSPPANPDPGDLWYVVDTNELKIRNSGVWVLSSTIGASWGDNISGQPSDTQLLNQNQQWSEVTGTGKPADNADVTADNTAAAITGQGAFATLDMITPSNISTYIANLTVDNAHIKNLAVDTLKIANNAVTNTVSAFANALIMIPTTSTMTPMLELVIVTSGGVVLLFASIKAEHDEYIPITLHIVDDSGLPVADLYGEAVTCPHSGGGSTTFTGSYTPAPGTHTLKLTARTYTNDGVGKARCFNRSLIVTEVKK